jgi:hypothetical protein
VVEYLPSKSEALSSNSSTTKQTTKQKVDQKDKLGRIVERTNMVEKVWVVGRALSVKHPEPISLFHHLFLKPSKSKLKTRDKNI